VKPLALGALLASAALTWVDAQPAVRRATNLAALLAYPAFYHARPIILVGTVGVKPNGDLEITSGATSIHLVTKVYAPDGVDEIRGEFWDLGRMKSDDPRLVAYDLKSAFHLDPNTPWPRPGDVTALIAAAILPASAPLAPSIHAIVLNPTRYLDQRVTITGQYAGRNLTGDLPDALGKSRYDFVLRSADSAIWVSGIPPRGKDFDLGLDARIDTNRWLQVSGTLQQGHGLQWIDAEAGSLTLAKPPAETVAAEDETSVRVFAVPPPEVLFSAPTQDETEVSPTTTIRVQFSRDLNATTLKSHVRVGYRRADGTDPEPATEFGIQYNALGRVLEIKFTKPLEPFRTVSVQLLEGILGTDGQPLKPWTLTFSLGG
jgi:Big-like domain-containing protein